MKVTRSSKVSLKFVNKNKRILISELLVEYSRVCNLFIEMFWLNDFKAKDLTKKITDLPESWFSPRMRQCCAREALSMCKGAVSIGKENGTDPIKPKHHGKKMTLSSQVATIEIGKGSFDTVIKLYALGNSQKIYLPVKSHFHNNQFYNWKRCNSIDLHRNYIQFTYTKELPKIKGEATLGIDIGINKLLATSDHKFYGTEVKRLISKIRRKQFKSKAYYRAKTELKEYINIHVKKMFDEHKDVHCFVFENIKGMKRNTKVGKKLNSNFRKVLHNWNYRYLLDYLKGQTEIRRSSFRSVSAWYTSQTCPSCSHVEKGNRVLEQFKCLECDYTNDADFVGSFNIVTRFTTGRYGSGFKAI